MYYIIIIQGKEIRYGLCLAEQMPIEHLTLMAIRVTLSRLNLSLPFLVLMTIIRGHAKT